MDIKTSIENELVKAREEAFKSKLKVKVQELDKANKVVKGIENEIANLIEDYEDDV